MFKRSPLLNPFLFIATAAALLIHLAALYLEPLQIVLRVEPLEAAAWPRIVAVAATIVVAIEAHKWLRPNTRAARRSTPRR